MTNMCKLHAKKINSNNYIYKSTQTIKVVSSEHETLAFRIAAILLKLNLGDALSRQALADEFKVSERTIYRDLNRLGGIVDKLEDGRYQIAAAYRGKLTSKDLESFARLTGVDQLFPNASQRFLVALLDTLTHSSYLIKGHHYEEPKPHDSQFIQLDEAIQRQRICQLSYAGKPRTLMPYRLVNSKGIWYLAATENQQLKAFTFSRISQLSISNDSFTPNAEIQVEIESNEDIWYSSDKTEVLLTVAPQMAYYFLRRKLLPQQETIKQLENGGLIISSHISHANQILPLIRYWIPHVRIISPAELQLFLENEVKQYFTTA